MNRRHFLQLSAILLANAGFSRQAFARSNTLRYLCWDGYDLPALLNEFEQLNECDVLSEIINDSPAAYVKLSGAGHRNYDVASIDSPWLERLDREGSLVEIPDDLRRSRYEQYYPEFREQFLPKQVTPRNWLPTRWGWIGPTINTAHVKEEDYLSYAPCFARKNRGKIGVMDWGDWPILPIALYLGIDPYQPLDQYALETLRQAFRALFKNQPVFVPDISIGQKGIVDGSLNTVIGAGTYLTSALRRAGFSQIKTVLPVPRNGLKQGIIWTEGSGAIKGNPNQDLAMKLVEFTTSTHASYILSYLGATCNLTPNLDVEKMYSAEQRASLQIDDVAYVLKNSHVNRNAPSIGQMLQIWQAELFKAS